MNRRDYSFPVHLDETTKQQLLDLCEWHGLSQNAIVTMAIRALYRQDIGRDPQTEGASEQAS